MMLFTDKKVSFYTNTAALEEDFSSQRQQNEHPITEIFRF